MATLYLDKLWINLLDTGQGISVFTAFDKTLSRKVRGEVRQYAGGRQRSISSKGTAGSFGVVLVDVTQTQIDKLEGWLAQAVVIRDIRGRRFFGTIFEIAVIDKRSTTYYDVSIMLNEITYIEGT